VGAGATRVGVSDERRAMGVMDNRSRDRGENFLYFNIVIIITSNYAFVLHSARANDNEQVVYVRFNCAWPNLKSNKFKVHNKC